MTDECWQVLYKIRERATDYLERPVGTPLAEIRMREDLDAIAHMAEGAMQTKKRRLSPSS